MQTIIKHTVGPPHGIFFWPALVITKLRNAMEIPIGYQDKTGFHYGIEPMTIENSWPPLPGLGAWRAQPTF
jgi:hypothetical protein